MRHVLKITWIFFLLFSLGVYAQEKESERLKKEQKNLQEKISTTEKLLQNTKDNKNDLTGKISLLERKIEYRIDLRNNIQQQLNEIRTQIDNLQLDIVQLEQEIVKRKEQYKLMIIHAYKMRDSRASLIFILSAESFNQANKRMEYLEQLRKYRADQIRKIYASKEKLMVDLLLLEQKKKDKDELALTQETEQKKYIADREYQKKAINDLVGKEAQLQDELKAQKKKSREIQNAINAAINKEILASKNKEKNNPKTFEETKEIELSTKGFEDNKGRLPWPVSSGEITKGFGKQPHPLHPNVFTNNNGIDITTVKGSTVRAVYGGTVSSVIVIPGAGKAIIITHGEYRTIYSNLQETYVSAGDKVVPKQEIGALLVNPSGNSEVHFEIRKVSSDGQITNINPTYWLYK